MKMQKIRLAFKRFYKLIHKPHQIDPMLLKAHIPFSVPVRMRYNMQFLSFHIYDHTFPLRCKAPKGTKHSTPNAASQNLLECT